MDFLVCTRNLLLLLSLVGSHYKRHYSNDFDSPIVFSDRLKFFRSDLTDTPSGNTFGKNPGRNEGRRYGDNHGGNDMDGGHYGDNHGGNEMDGGYGDGGYDNVDGDSRGFNGEFSEVKKRMTRGNQIVSCRAGYSLLFCGIDHSSHHHRGHYNHDNTLAYTHPIDNKACACFLSKSGLAQNSKLKCQAWCHKGVSNITIVATNQLLFRSMRSSCPEESKVLGCHMQFSGGDHKKYDRFKRFFHPLEDGKGCFCMDFVGAKCISTCSSNIKNHLVVTSKPRSKEVRCPEGYVVTGCGVKQGKGKSTSGYPSVYVSSSVSCSCYFPSSKHSSYFYPSCYAVCVEGERVYKK